MGIATRIARLEAASSGEANAVAAERAAMSRQWLAEQIAAAGPCLMSVEQRQEGEAMAAAIWSHVYGKGSDRAA